MGISAQPASDTLYIHGKVVLPKETGGKRNFYHYDYMATFS